jgi:hypothetical protein
VRSTRAGTAVSAGSVPRGARFLHPWSAYRYAVVGGGISTTGPVRARPVRGRPHWWVVLAVTLALMALVTAASTGRQSRIGAQPYQAAQPGRHPTSNTVAPRPTVTTSTNSSSSTVIEQSATQPVTTTRTTSPPTVVATSTPTTVVATTTTTSTAGSGTGNSPMQTSAKNDQGFLEPPDDTTAIYTFNGTGLTTVTVTWTPQVELTLTATCADGTQSGEGGGSLELTLPDAQGACQLTLSEPASESADVTYSLTITPSDQ